MFPLSLLDNISSSNCAMEMSKTCLSSNRLSRRCAILTDHQLYAAGGGETLRREALIVEKTPRPLRRPGARVAHTLISTNLGIILAVLIGQARRDLVYTAENDFLDNLKVLGSRYDQVCTIVQRLTTSLG
jgi:hypothetical protein